MRNVWEQFRQDLRYAVRMLHKNSGFSAIAILSLALGIGANTAIFSLLNALVLRPLPVSEPQRLVQFTYTSPEAGPSWFDYPHLERFQSESKTLSGIFGGTGLGRVNVSFNGSAALAQADAYTANLFPVLGVAPQHGRLFSEGDDRTDTAVAILSDRYWRNRFGADPSVVGSTVAINLIPFTVIGITPQDFTGISVGTSPDLWVPLHAMDRLKPDSRRWTEPFTRWLLIAGRLRPGVSRAQAQAELDVIYRQLNEEQLSAAGLRRRNFFESHLVLRPAANGMYSGLRDRYAYPLSLLMGVAGIVLLVACANVANLLLARASGRRGEIAIRLALGAGRSRVVRQFLTECIVLASIGGALAIAMAWWGSGALVHMISTGDSPIPLNAHPDWRVFSFAAAVSLLTGILFGLGPAVRGTRVDPSPAIKEGARRSSRQSQSLDRVLVVVQVALSVVLITGAGLFVRTLQNLWRLDMGYQRANVLMFSADARAAGYAAERAGAVYREILQRMQGLPDVQSASASIVRPVDDQFSLSDRIGDVDGRRLAGGEAIQVAWNAISPGYFATIETPILLGRDFRPSDNENSLRVVIINQSLAARAFGLQNPIGHSLARATIVGVAKDSRYNGARDQVKPVLYYPLFQHGAEQEYRWGFVSFELRYRSGAGLLDAVRLEIAAVDRNLPMFRAKTLYAQSEQSLLRERLLALLSSFFGVLALALSCLGLYGLMAWAVTRRTSEIGLRAALGAPREHILWLVLRETLLLTLTGVAIGAPAAVWAARYAQSMLFGAGVADPLTIAGAIALTVTLAALMGCIPVRRALRVDPLVALRYE
jgi:predicted permease